MSTWTEQYLKVARSPQPGGSGRRRWQARVSSRGEVIGRLTRTRPLTALELLVLACCFVLGLSLSTPVPTSPPSLVEINFLVSEQVFAPTKQALAKAHPCLLREVRESQTISDCCHCNYVRPAARMGGSSGPQWRWGVLLLEQGALRAPRAARSPVPRRQTGPTSAQESKCCGGVQEV